MGFGGAFTEAAAKNFFSLSGEGQEAALELLFGDSGLGYNLGRTHINSCDFSVKSYDFDHRDGDFELKHFKGVAEKDGAEMLPFMKRSSEKLAEDWGGENLKIVASPWSPPAWMKEVVPEKEKGKVNDDGMQHAKNMLGSAQGTCIRDGVSPSSKYARVWAEYFSRWISAYKAWGVRIWGITVQNEPEFAAPWEACMFNSTTEGAFVNNHLGPVFKQEHPKVKILGFDHNKVSAFAPART